MVYDNGEEYCEEMANKMLDGLNGYEQGDSVRAVLYIVREIPIAYFRHLISAKNLKTIMNIETLIINPKGEDFELIIIPSQTGSSYGITISKGIYNQLQKHFNNKLIEIENAYVEDNYNVTGRVNKLWITRDEFNKVKCIKNG